MKRCFLHLLILWCLLIVLPSVVWYTLIPQSLHKPVTSTLPDLNVLMPSVAISNSSTRNPTQDKVQHNQVVYPLMHLCNLPGKETIQSYEGQFPDEYSLIGVITIFRHGDRGPLAKLRTRTKVNCSSYATSLYGKFEQAVRNYGSKSITEKLLPSSDFCQPGLLTKQGSSQLLELGKVLNDSYSKHLDEITPFNFSNVIAFTTPNSRTVQSMHSLLFGMFDRTSLLRVKIQSRSQVSFCFKHCHCSATDRFEKLHKKELVERVSRDSFFRNFFEQIRPLQSDMEKPSTIELPSTIRDIASVYVCHNLTFPWFSAKNSQPNSFRAETLLEALKREANISSSGINLRKAGVLRSYGLYMYMNQKIELWISKSQNSDSNKKFRPMFLFVAGHDLTLMYMLAALGIYDGYLPYYASRLTFEILRQKENYYIRIIWNGKEITSRVCTQETGVYCKANFLRTMPESLLTSYFGTSNFWEACEM